VDGRVWRLGLLCLVGCAASPDEPTREPTAAELVEQDHERRVVAEQVTAEMAGVAPVVAVEPPGPVLEANGPPPEPVDWCTHPEPPPEIQAQIELGEMCNPNLGNPTHVEAYTPEERAAIEAEHERARKEWKRKEWQRRKAATSDIATSDAPTRSCCRYCSSGIPCGNSCISASKQCHQPPGCAC